MRDELEQVPAVDGGLPEALTVPEAVRVQATAAGLHDRAGTALGRERVGADLPGDGRRVVKDVVKAVRHDVKAGVGRAGIGGAERVELLNGAIGIDDNQRAWQQPEPLHCARLPEDQLDKLAEQADPRLLPGGGVPALEDADQPFRIPRAGRSAVPVRVRQQQVKRRRAEPDQRLVRAHRIVARVDRAQDAAVTVPELERPQQVKAAGDSVETASATGVPAVPPGRLSVPVQADTHPDPQAAQDRQHRAVQESAVSLDGHVHLGGHGGVERADQVSQPARSREQRLTAVQDDIDGGQAMLFHVLGNTLNGSASDPLAHSPGLPAPSLVRHFIDIAIRARQVTTAMNFQDELLEGDRLMPGRPDRRQVEVEDRPPGRVAGCLCRCHSNQAAKSSGSTRVPWPARQACTSNSSGRRQANDRRADITGGRLAASASPIQVAGSGSAASSSR